MAEEFIIIIPVRFDSTRFPGKPLCMINGKTMLEHVYQRCKGSQAKKIIIATDSTKIQQAAESFCSNIIMTDTNCQTGTERIAQAVTKLTLDQDKIIINVQGDEPLISASNINQLATVLSQNKNTMVASLYQQIDSMADLINANVVKVVTDINDMAICFTRGEIPYSRNRSEIQSFLEQKYYKKHIGIYGYRASFLTKLDQYPMTYHEEIERLEQMTWLAHGVSIKMAQAKQQVAMDVNTHEDLEKICQIWDELSVV